MNRFTDFVNLLLEDLGGADITLPDKFIKRKKPAPDLLKFINNSTIEGTNPSRIKPWNLDVWLRWLLDEDSEVEGGFLLYKNVAMAAVIRHKIYVTSNMPEVSELLGLKALFKGSNGIGVPFTKTHADQILKCSNSLGNDIQFFLYHSVQIIKNRVQNKAEREAKMAAKAERAAARAEKAAAREAARRIPKDVTEDFKTAAKACAFIEKNENKSSAINNNGVVIDGYRYWLNNRLEFDSPIWFNKCTAYLDKMRNIKIGVEFNFNTGKIEYFGYKVDKSNYKYEG